MSWIRNTDAKNILQISRNIYLYNGKLVVNKKKINLELNPDQSTDDGLETM